MRRPSERNKFYATQLAQEIMSRKGNTDAVNTLKIKLGIDNRAKENNQNDQQQNRVNYYPGENVGIWKPEIRDGKKYYVRDSTFKQEYKYWANIDSIAPKNDEFRVILLGESVARGYFYDPLFNPAIVLQKICNFFDPKIKIIDLAKVGLSIKLLLKFLYDSVVLKPDAIIIFAGNNWSYNMYPTLSLQDIKTFYELSRQEDYSKYVLSFIESKLEEQVKNFIAELSSFKIKCKIPYILFIIPENNMIDYRCNDLQKIHVYPYKKLHEWIFFIEEVNEYLKDKNIEKIKELCNNTISEGFNNPYIYELLGYCDIISGNYRAANKNYKKAKDIMICQGIDTLPCIHSVTQRKLNSLLKNKNIDCVNLSEIFAGFLDGKPTERSLFLDYCHLNAHGIKIAMYHVAKKIIKRIKSINIQPSVLNIEDLNPSNKISAHAHFFAAIHNAQCGQSSNIIEYHCMKAIEYFPEIINEMKNTVTMLSYNNKKYINSEFERFFESGILLEYRFQLPYSNDVMYIKLVDSIVKILSQKKIRILDKIDQLRSLNHGIYHKKLNLLNSNYRLTYNQGFDRRQNENAFFIKFYNSESRFSFITEIVENLQLKLTLRIPDVLPNDSLVLKLNKVYDIDLHCDSGWKSYIIQLPPKALFKGVNEILIYWPIHNLVHHNQNDSFYFDFVSNHLKEVFGEIHTFFIYRNS